MRKLTEDKGQAFFNQYAGMVHGVLKRLGVWHTHADYDNFVQHSLLKLVEAYENYPKDLEQLEYLQQFDGYAYTSVRWRMVDLMRQYRPKWKKKAWSEDLEANMPDTRSSIEQNYEEMDLLKNILPLLTKKEQNYLVDAAVNRLSVTKIAQKQGVSRKMVYE